MIYKIQKQYLDLNYTITVKLSDIPIEDDFDFGDKEEDEKYLRRFEIGELASVDILIEMFSKSGIVSGCSSLGACHIKANDMETEVMSYIMDYELASEAYSDLLANIREVDKQDLKQIKQGSFK